MIDKIRKKIGLIYNSKAQNLFGQQIIERSSFSSPDFMIIGAAKAGTTSLFQYLAQHPQVIPPEEKELKYFGMSNQWRGLGWYLKNFPSKEIKKDKLTFEATPTYLFLEQSPKLISELYPKLKFIALLRDPVARAFSHWNFYQEHSKVSYRTLIDRRTFEQAVNQELKGDSDIPWIHRYLARGLYAEQLKRWYRYFEREQLLILDFEEFKTNPYNSLAEVSSFINVENVYKDFEKSTKKMEGLLGRKDVQNNMELKNYNFGKYSEKIEPLIENKLKAFFREPNQELFELTGKKFHWMD